MKTRISGRWWWHISIASCIGISMLTPGGALPGAGPAPAAAADHHPAALGFLELQDVSPSPAAGTPSGQSAAPAAYGVPSPSGVAAPVASPSGADVKVLPINLPSALQLANAGNPTIALARARVEEAYARLREADVLWVPDLRGGPSYLRHDGLIQNARGDVFNTSKQSFFIGGGAVMSWDTSYALFGPLIARQLVQAQTAASRAVADNIQLDVALTYLDLLRVYGALAINAETLAKAQEMLHSAESAERAGLGKTTADPNRARTEVELRREERIDLEGQAASVSARLAQLLQMEPTVDLLPADAAVIPITLVPADGPIDELVATGLMNRPELAEGRSLVAAALARWRQARVGPLLPHLNLSYTAGEFGAGFDDNLNHWGGRGDGLAEAVWELHNFGLGDAYRAQARRAQYSQANFHVAEVEAQVGAEVTAAAKVVRARLRSLSDAQAAVQQAEEMWRRLAAAAFGLVGGARRYDPLEPLLAEQALNQARMRYLTDVIEYNKSQFRLYWAMGQPPLCALPAATAVLVDVPVLPQGKASETLLPRPHPVSQADR